MSYAGNPELVTLAMTLRRRAFEKGAGEIAATVFAPFQTKLASTEPTLAVATKHPTLFLHFTKP